MYNEILELIIEYSKEIMDEIGPNIDEYEFIEKLVKSKIFKRIDWSGEDENGEIIEFVIQKIKTFNNETININGKEIINEIENNIKKGTLKKGDSPIIIFNRLDKQLKIKNYQLIFLNNGTDEYIFTVVSKRNYKKLIKCNKITFEKVPKLEVKVFFIVCEKCGNKFPPEYYNGKEYINCDCGKIINVLEEILK
jgi:hypothetical protein